MLIVMEVTSRVNAIDNRGGGSDGNDGSSQTSDVISIYK